MDACPLWWHSNYYMRKLWCFSPKKILMIFLLAKYHQSWFRSPANLPEKRSGYDPGAVCVETGILASALASCPILAAREIDGIVMPKGERRRQPPLM